MIFPWNLLLFLYGILCGLHTCIHFFFFSNHFQHVKELMTLDMIQYIIWKRQYRLTTTIIAITGWQFVNKTFLSNIGQAFSLRGIILGPYVLDLKSKHTTSNHIYYSFFFGDTFCMIYNSIMKDDNISQYGPENPRDQQSKLQPKEIY